MFGRAGRVAPARATQARARPGAAPAELLIDDQIVALLSISMFI